MITESDIVIGMNEVWLFGYCLHRPARIAPTEWEQFWLGAVAVTEGRLTNAERIASLEQQLRAEERETVSLRDQLTEANGDLDDALRRVVRQEEKLRSLTVKMKEVAAALLGVV